MINLPDLNLFWYDHVWKTPGHIIREAADGIAIEARNLYIK